MSQWGLGIVALVPLGHDVTGAEDRLDDRRSIHLDASPLAPGSVEAVDDDLDGVDGRDDDLSDHVGTSATPVTTYRLPSSTSSTPSIEYRVVPSATTSPGLGRT